MARNFGLNKIFVEGKTDKVFIEAILFKYFEIDCSLQEYRNIVVSTEGKDKLINQPDLISTERKETGAKNLIIFDADFIDSGGGFVKRKSEILEIGNKKEIANTFRVVLFPNNEDEGQLEHLIKTCFKEDFKFFDTCWQSMIECFKANQNEHLVLKLPTLKGYKFSYIELFEKHKSVDIVRNEYLDTGLWTLDTDQNPMLRKLVDFIDSNFFED